MRIALVTGGVKGIGRAISLALVNRGFFVVSNYSSSEDHAASLVAEVGNDKCMAFKFDVGDPGQVINGIKEIENNFGGIDVLVNNAGITKDDLLVRLSQEDIEKVIRINLLGAIFCAQSVIKGMLKKRWGRIINISSVIGEIGNAGQTAYSASKAGLIGFTKSLAKEVGSRNITVNAITPGYIETDMTKHLNNEIKQSMLKLIPAGRFGVGEDVASLVSFLVTDEASYINGAILPVNGGMN